MVKPESVQAPSFAALVQAFFAEHLQQQRAMSPRTVAAYRDAFVLFLDFAQARLHKQPTAIRLEQITPTLILAFLDHLERERGNTVRSRNARLAALRAFLKFAGRRDVSALHVVEQALGVPMKRFERPMLGFLSREEMLQLALMSSENRAASSLARHYPGGEAAFVDAMNVKARLLGLWNTRFHDSTGLNPANVSSPRDLAKMVAASASYPLIREFSTAHERYVPVHGRMLRFGNTNSLVRSPEWTISVSKTGYISEAGRCLVMQTWLHQQPVVMVLMDSYGRYTRTADAKRVRKWLEQTAIQRLAAAPQGAGG